MDHKDGILITSKHTVVSNDFRLYEENVKRVAKKFNMQPCTIGPLFKTSNSQFRTTIGYIDLLSDKKSMRVLLNGIEIGYIESPFVNK